ncbi:Uncharacterised protein [Mycobacterium tuberculosis]|nr:Uncharacterised protein [Mycobacterium tuberculosis]
MVTRPSIRASGPPGQLCAPRANATFCRALGRSARSSAGQSKWRGSRLAAPGSSITVVPAASSTPPSVVATRVNRKSLLIGLSKRSISSTKFGMRSRLARNVFCRSGSSASTRKELDSSRAVVSCPATNRKVAMRTRSTTSGSEPSANRWVAISVKTSWAGDSRRSLM